MTVVCHHTGRINWPDVHVRRDAGRITLALRRRHSWQASVVYGDRTALVLLLRAGPVRWERIACDSMENGKEVCRYSKDSLHLLVVILKEKEQGKKRLLGDLKGLRVI